jgi:ribosome-binding protein aMBF1 (putative translation factor)
MARKRQPTSDAAEIIRRRYFADRSSVDLEKAYQEEKGRLGVAQAIYELRTKAGLSQRALAKLVGTTASVISRLEDADYEGHSLATLRRIATALDKRLEIRFVPASRKGRAA